MTGRIKKIAFFLAFTFGLTWAVEFICLAGGVRWDSYVFSVVAAIAMFFPSAGVIVTQKIIDRDSWKNLLRLNFRINRWFFIAWLLPWIIAAAALGVSMVMPGASFASDLGGAVALYKNQLPQEAYARMQSQMASMPVHPFLLAVIAAIMGGITLNTFFGYGEELGWRGLLFDELRPLGFWRSSLLIGVVWGLWHAPLMLMGFHYPHAPVLGIAMMTVFCTLFSPVMCFIRLKSKSVIAAAILHGSFNATYILVIFFLKGGSEFLVGVFGLAGFIVLAVADVMIFVYLKLKPPAPFQQAQGDLSAKPS
jgi:uncharacterized protein